ncbi:S41 family peptidase [Aquimarina longa]|uniref:S41 family peptidase n=1 Tax=Aquimarina longa TaxID=1080221 RepID=UPI000785800D|nr:S41 family peptidase [Aquimarina longa]
MKTKILFGTLLLIQFSFSQELEINELTYDDYFSDLQVLNKTIEAQHPNPYKYVSKEEQQKKQRIALNRLKKEPSYPKFLQALNRFGDGHLQYDFPEEFIDNSIMKFSFFPFPVLVREGKMFVNYKNGVIPFGNQISSIQGTSIKSILKKINEHVHGDGYINSHTEEQVSLNFPFLYSYFMHTKTTIFSIEYIDDITGLKKTIQIPAIDYYENYRRNRLAIHPVNQLEIAENIHGRYYPSKKTGVLTVNSFDSNEASAYKSYSKFFKTINIEGYQTVIIDIRNNTGGDPNIAALLFSFIVDQNFKNIFNYRVSSIKVNSENLMNDYGNPAGENEIEEFENFLYQRFNLNENIYIGNDRLKEGVLENFPPDKDNFKGEVYVITGGQTFSAAVYFAKLFKKYKRGTVIGLETGGNENTTFAGYFLNYKLPKTKLKVRIPIAELYFDDISDTNHGVLPDRIIPLSQYINYLKQEKDPEIQYILDLKAK